MRGGGKTPVSSFRSKRRESPPTTRSGISKEIQMQQQLQDDLRQKAIERQQVMEKSYIRAMEDAQRRVGLGKSEVASSFMDEKRRGDRGEDLRDFPEYRGPKFRPTQVYN